MNESYCSQCGQRLRFPGSDAGKRVACPRCGAQIFTREIEAFTPALEAGHARNALSINVHLPRRSTSLGIASFVLGIVAFFICLIPCFGAFALPIAFVGIGLGIVAFLVALSRRGSGIGYPIGGLVTSGIALLISGIWATAFSAANAAKIKNQDEIPQQARPTYTHLPPVASTRVAPTNPRTPGGPKWININNPVRKGDIEVRITEVLAGNVPLVRTCSGLPMNSQKQLLSVRVWIRNLTKNLTLKHKSWGGHDYSDKHPLLRDNSGTILKCVGLGVGTDVSVNDDSGVILPERALKDILVFERPHNYIRFLTLELPAANFGGEGIIRFKIPAKRIRAVDDEVQRPEPREPATGAEVPEGTQRQADTEVTGKPSKNEKTVLIPDYELLEKKVVDVPLKAEVDMSVLVSGNLTEAGLRELLENLYSSIMTDGAYSHHAAPTNVFIDAYISRERFAAKGTGQWIAQLRKSFYDANPEISIDEGQLSSLHSPQQRRLGRSEDERKRIYYKLIDVDQRAACESDEKLPALDPLKAGYSIEKASEREGKRISLERRLVKKYRKKIDEEFELKNQDALAILSEGHSKGWTEPPFPCDGPETE